MAECPLHGCVEPVEARGHLKCPDCGQFLVKTTAQSQPSTIPEGTFTSADIEELLDEHDVLVERLDAERSISGEVRQRLTAEVQLRERLERALADEREGRISADRGRREQVQVNSVLTQQVRALDSRVRSLRQNPFAFLFEPPAS